MFLDKQVAYQCAGVFAIKNGKPGLQVQRLALGAYDLQAQLVERADCEPLGNAAAQYFAHPLLHFPGRFVGKGHGGDAACADTAGFNQIGDLASDYTGLAAARAGEHQQGAIDIAHGFALTRVELGH